MMPKDAAAHKVAVPALHFMVGSKTVGPDDRTGGGGRHHSETTTPPPQPLYKKRFPTRQVYVFAAP